ncbi:hypothetical protein C0J52_08361 [Blattella germanica]|nr:hypothetical protein C0J52_08361 [Blattella germanica]
MVTWNLEFTLKNHGLLKFLLKALLGKFEKFPLLCLMAYGQFIHSPATMPGQEWPSLE